MSLDKLSPRERQCLERAARHTPYKLIAAELGIEVGTIDGYLGRAARKLGVNRREALLMVLQAEPPGFAVHENQGVDRQRLDAPASRGRGYPWPFATTARPDNDLTPSGTIIAIIIASTTLLAMLALVILATKILSQPG